jgi:hypothetical protein
VRRRAWFVVLLVLVALVGATAGESAGAAALVPAPGTGHGALTGAPPSGETKSFAYTPGVGNGCSLPPEAVSAYGAGYPGHDGPDIEVGLPVHVCVGEFPGGSVDVSITPPLGRTVVVPKQTFTRSNSTITLIVRVLPRPPQVRIRVTRLGVPIATGALRGDGSGRYTIVASGGGKRTTETFTLEPAPVPQLVDLGDSEQVEPGGRARFAATGQRPLSLFRVGIYGPQSSNPTGSNPVPLRTTIAARADRRGEAIVTLDIARTSDLGTYYAVLEPFPSVDSLRHPRLVVFFVLP